MYPARRPHFVNGTSKVNAKYEGKIPKITAKTHPLYKVKYGVLPSGTNDLPQAEEAKQAHARGQGYVPNAF